MKWIFFLLVLISCSWGHGVGTCPDCFFVSAFADYLDSKYEGGVEVNRWFNFEKTWFGYGGGARLRVNQDFDKYYASVYPMASAILFLGIAAGPEIGVYGRKFDYGGSFRFWFTFVGGDIIKTKRTSTKFHLYIFLPLIIPPIP